MGWLQTSNPRVPLGSTATVTLFTSLCSICLLNFFHSSFNNTSTTYVFFFVLVSMSRILHYPVREWFSILLLMLVWILGTCSSTDWGESIVMSQWIEMPGSSNVKHPSGTHNDDTFKFTSIQFLPQVVFTTSTSRNAVTSCCHVIG